MRQLEFFFQLRPSCIDPTWPSQAIPYHTKPRHFRPIYRPFWPIFGAKVLKTHRKQFQGVQPLKIHICMIHFPLVPLLGKFIRFSNASDYMCNSQLIFLNACDLFFFVWQIHIPSPGLLRWRKHRIYFSCVLDALVFCRM